MPSRTLTIWLLAFFLGLFLSPFIARSTGPTQGRLIEAPTSYIQTKLFEDYAFISGLTGKEEGDERDRKQTPLYPLHLQPQATRQSLQARKHPSPDPEYATVLTERHASMGSAVTILPESVVRITFPEGKLWRHGQRILHEFVLSEMEGPQLGNGTAAMVEYTRTWQGPALVLILREKGYLRGWVGRKGEAGMIDAKAFDRFTAAVEKAWEEDVASLGGGL
ncbi:hypothetical protein KC356_g8924 [Hortaea werneckii]|nr:hypothetical protein KC356_g8924 [Hortaea werneckii]